MIADLTIQEEIMSKRIIRDRRPNCEIRWSYSRSKDLVARKVTNPFSGDVRISFGLLRRRLYE